jgi:hypothetical protein
MLHKLGVTQYLAYFIAATRWDDIPAAASMITCAGSGEPIPVWAARLAFPDLFCIAGGGLWPKAEAMATSPWRPVSGEHLSPPGAKLDGGK